jgi:hypothetical protein
MTTTHANVTGITIGIENVEHELYFASFCLSPDLSDGSHTETIHCCGTVRPQ